MSPRSETRASAREARREREAQLRTAAVRRRRLRALAAAVLAVVALGLTAIAVSTGGGSANAAAGGKLRGVAASSALFAGIPQRGTLLGRPNAPVRVIEFADLQCPYCQEYTAQVLPALVRDYVRPGKVQMEFENLSFIGPDSVEAGHYAAAAAAQNKLWNFVDLMYLNQGVENTGYATPSYLRGLLKAVPGLNVAAALSASEASGASEALTRAAAVATMDGINATPSFLIGRLGGPLQQFQPPTLTPGPFATVFNSLLGGAR